MEDKILYLNISEQSSRLMTKAYSGSFYRSIGLLAKEIRQPILNIYGMVRLADEIVDTFHVHEDTRDIFNEFKKELWNAVERKYSPNIILHAFQRTFHAYGIEKRHVEAFLESMEMDLNQSTFDEKSLTIYIYGSAEVIGLMCLKVFTHKNPGSYREYESCARLLGSVFQKINFIRDVGSDYAYRKRIYFPFLGTTHLDEEKRKILEREITIDMDRAKEGILKLPDNSRLAVYVAYTYYRTLLRKMSKKSIEDLLRRRVSIGEYRKIYILLLCKTRCLFGIL